MNPVLHGLVFGLLLLVAFLAAMVGISSLTPTGGKRIGLAVGASWALAVLGWLAVVTGMMMMTRYNARPPDGTTDPPLPARAVVVQAGYRALHAAGMIWKSTWRGSRRSWRRP